MRAQRRVTAQTAGDGQAYLEFQGGATNGFAVENLGGEAVLSFDSRPRGGNGLNPDAVSTFDDVLRLNNTGASVLELSITDTQERVEFYFGEEVSDGSLTDDDTATARLAPGSEPLRVGVRIDLQDTTATAVFGDDDNFTIVAEDPDGS